MMELEVGAEVKDKSGKVLGTVDHLARDTWTGEIRKFVVRREAPQTDLFLSPSDVLEVKQSKVKLKVTAEELSEK